MSKTRNYENYVYYSTARNSTLKIRHWRQCVTEVDTSSQ